MDDRYNKASTLVTSQLPMEKWHVYLNDPTLADAILDRLVHNAYKLNLKGDSMRARKGATIDAERVKTQKPFSPSIGPASPECAEARDAFSAYTAFRKKLQPIAAHLRKTLTYDQGSEMAEHARLTDQLGIEVYFCDPHSPWQRAGCENTNGLLRDYLPKGMDMTDLTQAELDKIAFQMNERPRKTLNWRTPNEVWKGILSGKSFQEIVALGT